MVWRYVRFNLSLREVEETLLERGIDMSYETVRRWMLKFGPLRANNLRSRQRRPSNVWHLDALVVNIARKSFYLWRAVDQDSFMLEEILQSKRNKRAAKRLLIRLIKRHGFQSKRIITDKLRSYGAAKREVAPSLDHWPHKGLNNRAQNSHPDFGNVKERRRASDRQVGCNVSLRFIPPSETACPYHPAAVQPSPSV
ncbi:MAG: IS6 family transposase, partial [Paracoccaceae bacterium]